ncbi:hypothetical protein [Muribaculum intestinale]|uniref:hypothetical protein n=1 Tax=Muribaculum intestinale TaxID=1796646 RepID=UPI0025AA0EB5|nr:hypothetical protein [Muribaculum intestinale]
MIHILLTLVLSIATIAAIAIVAMKLLLNKKTKKLSIQIESITPYTFTQKKEKHNLKQDNAQTFTDIKNDLEQSYNGKYITVHEENQFTDYYVDLFNAMIR